MVLRSRGHGTSEVRAAAGQPILIDILGEMSCPGNGFQVHSSQQSRIDLIPNVSLVWSESAPGALAVSGASP